MVKMFNANVTVFDTSFILITSFYGGELQKGFKIFMLIKKKSLKL